MYGKGEGQALPPGRRFKGKVLVPLEANTPKVVPVELFLALVLSFYGGWKCMERDLNCDAISVERSAISRPSLDFQIHDWSKNSVWETTFGRMSVWEVNSVNLHALLII